MSRVIEALAHCVVNTPPPSLIKKLAKWRNSRTATTFLANIAFSIREPEHLHNTLILFISNAIPTNYRLSIITKRSETPIPNRCRLCNQPGETLVHLLITCPTTSRLRTIAQRLMPCINLAPPPERPVMDELEWLLTDLMLAGRRYPERTCLARMIYLHALWATAASHPLVLL
jgi:hypothetical protein